MYKSGLALASYKKSMVYAIAFISIALISYIVYFIYFSGNAGSINQNLCLSNCVTARLSAYLSACASIVLLCVMYCCCIIAIEH